jgi:hypothetical protein
LKRPGGEIPPGPVGEGASWVELESLSEEDLKVGQKVLMKIWYGGEEGLIHGTVKENTTDSEGRWVGLAVLGTQVHQLRSFLITSPPPAPLLYLSKIKSSPEQRLTTPGIGYLLSYREVTYSRIEK